MHGAGVGSVYELQYLVTLLGIDPFWFVTILYNFVLSFVFHFLRMLSWVNVL